MACEMHVPKERHTRHLPEKCNLGAMFQLSLDITLTFAMLFGLFHGY